MAKIIDRGSVPADSPLFKSGPILHSPMPSSELTKPSPKSAAGGKPESKPAPPKEADKESTEIGDQELWDWLAMKATKAAAKDQERLKKEAELHRQVFSKPTPDDSTKT